MTDSTAGWSPNEEQKERINKELLPLHDSPRDFARKARELGAVFDCRPSLILEYAFKLRGTQT